MTVEESVRQRAESKCELCDSDEEVSMFEVPPVDSSNSDRCVLLCGQCLNQVNESQALDVNHWRCLNSSMWSEVPVVQILAWRMLKRLSTESWAQDLFDMLYFDEEMLAWAEQGISDESEELCLDSYGTVLNAGDTVSLIKDLDVKGAGFTAKRGTTVKNISLTDNPAHIEGRVNGVRIVLLTQYLKRQN